MSCIIYLAQYPFMTNIPGIEKKFIHFVVTLIKFRMY